MSRYSLLIGILLPLCGFAQVDTSRVFTDLSDAKKNPTLVYHLELRKDRLKVIPGEVRKMVNLRTLDLGKNSLDSLPQWLPELDALRFLNLEKNEFERFPEVLCGMSHLEVLNLSRNSIVRIPNCIVQMGALRRLDMWNTELEVLPEIIGKMPNLVEIDVRFSYIDRRHLSEMPFLKGKKVYATQGCDCDD